MFAIGEINTLRILRSTSVGLYLGDKDGNDVLLPNKYVSEDFKIDDLIDVFVYKDYEQRWVATTLMPFAKIHEFAYLRVRDVSQHGAFLEWGLEKDLFVPFREQRIKMESGRRYVVYIYQDEETQRLVASTKLNRFLSNEELSVAPGDKVNLVVMETTPLGYNVIINQRHKGLVYHNEIFQEIVVGDRLEGYIKLIRSEDNGIDVSLQPKGVKRLESGAQQILDVLKKSKGFLALHDKSEPSEIMRILNMSKKNFKNSVGILYKQRIISLAADGIRMIETK
jgi:predicted RNA-binding protein (virulence factor B family)